MTPTAHPQELRRLAGKLTIEQAEVICSRMINRARRDRVLASPEGMGRALTIEANAQALLRLVREREGRTEGHFAHAPRITPTYNGYTPPAEGGERSEATPRPQVETDTGVVPDQPMCSICAIKPARREGRCINCLLRPASREVTVIGGTYG